MSATDMFGAQVLRWWPLGSQSFSQHGSDALAVRSRAPALMLRDSIHSVRPPWREIAGTVSVGTWQPHSSSWHWSSGTGEWQLRRSRVAMAANAEEGLLQALRLLTAAPTDALLRARARLSTPEQKSTCWAIVAARTTNVAALQEPLAAEGSLLCNIFWTISMARLVLLASNDTHMELYRHLHEEHWANGAPHYSDNFMMMNLVRRVVWERLGSPGLQCLGQSDLPHDSNKSMSPAAAQTLTAMRWLAATPAVLIAAAERAAFDNADIGGPDFHVAGFLVQHVLPWSQCHRSEHQNCMFNGWRTTPARDPRIPSVSHFGCLNIGGGEHCGRLLL